MKRVLIALPITLFSLSTFASNFNFMNYSPLDYFRGNDLKMMQDNIDKALDKTADNVKLSWKNPQTGTWGYVLPSRTAQQNGTICRNAKIYTNAQQVTGMMSYRFCKINGAWKVVS